jgi:hypothetical protein
MRLFFFVLSGGLVLLAACGGSDAEEAADVTPQATPQATVEATPQATAEPTAQATPPWAGRQADLKDSLGEMVLTKEDLPTSLNWLDPVDNPPEELQPIIAPQRDPLTMNGLAWRPGSSGPLRDSPWAASAFVGPDANVWLWSFVSLPPDLAALSAARRAIIDAGELDVARLRLDIWDSLMREDLDFKPETMRIGGARGLGDVRFSYSLSLFDVEGVEQYQLQGLAFIRGPVFAVLIVVCRPGTLVEDDGLYLALTLDDKVRQTLKAAGLPEA